MLHELEVAVLPLAVAPQLSDLHMHGSSTLQKAAHDKAWDGPGHLPAHTRQHHGSVAESERKDFPKVAGGFRSAGKPNEVCEVCHLAYT